MLPRGRKKFNINEDLPLSIKLLFNKVRSKAKQNNKKYIFVENGNIWVKKRKYFKSLKLRSEIKLMFNILQFLEFIFQLTNRC